MKRNTLQINVKVVKSYPSKTSCMLRLVCTRCNTELRRSLCARGEKYEIATYNRMVAKIAVCKCSN